jgi:hypothetical protein
MAPSSNGENTYSRPGGTKAIVWPGGGHDQDHFDRFSLCNRHQV